jgi:TatD DNase family protein
MDLNESIKFIDFHTHNGHGTADTVAVVNLMAGDDLNTKLVTNTLFSAGIHPWHLTAENADLLKTELIFTMAHPHVVMIGEAGFDTLRGPEMNVQYNVFCYQAEIAEEVQKPLIIHCVKGWDLLLKAKEEIKPSVKWIIHGFRGKKELAQSLAKEGFLFSLGEKGISDDIVEKTGWEKLFPETDDSGSSIKDVYRKFSEVTGKSPEDLIKIFRQNFNNCFDNPE